MTKMPEVAPAGQRPDQKQKPQVFSLKTPLVSEGTVNNVVVDSDNLWVWVKVYASGGENFIHAHMAEDHSFIVMDGEATFHFPEGKDTVVGKYGGILIPRGAYYSFTSTGSGPLVLLRVGGGAARYHDSRVWWPGEVDDRAERQRTVENGEFFGDPEAEKLAAQ